jgi:SAM-dependent methyltransferase
MADATIRFDDGASYELMMGRWSVLVGERFIDWIGVPIGVRWLDIGCGNGAFTELVVRRCMPSDVQAFDPSAEQLAYARNRLPAGAPVTWTEGDALRLPVADAAGDAAVMALVLFFVPEPDLAVAEMCRAVRPGGVVAAYHWDILGGGFPLADIAAEMLKLGVPPRLPPSAAASPIEAYTLRPMFEAMQSDRRDLLKANVRLRLQASDGPLTVSARANAVSGIKP